MTDFLTDDERESHTFTAGPDHAGVRIDKALSDLADYSRTRLKALIESGDVLVNETVCTDPSRKVCEGDVISLTVPPPEELDVRAQDIPLDIVFEDENLLVINKAPGMVVHPGAGHADGTLVNALLHHCGESLSGIGGVMRPGIVHRLDRDTSGLMIVAKCDQAHHALAAQLADRSLRRVYHAFVLGVPVPPGGRVDRAIGRHPSNRLKMAIRRQGGKVAVTNYRVLESCSDEFSLVECRLETGRTHQIRVHMESIGHPLVGDPLYGPQKTALTAALKRAGFEEHKTGPVTAFSRQALHACEICFEHPVSGENMSFSVPYCDDMKSLLSLFQ